MADAGSAHFGGGSICPAERQGSDSGTQIAISECPPDTESGATSRCRSGLEHPAAWAIATGSSGRSASTAATTTPASASTGVPGLFDLPQRPAEASQRENLLSFLFLQDVAHAGAGTSCSRPVSTSRAAIGNGRFSAAHQWPDLGAHRGSTQTPFPVRRRRPHRPAQPGRSVSRGYPGRA